MSAVADDLKKGSTSESSTDAGSSHDNPAIRNGFIDSIRPGGHRHKEIHSNIKLVDKQIADLENLAATASDADLADPNFLGMYKIKAEHSPTEVRLKVIPSKARASKGQLTQLYNELKGNEDTIRAHDAGEAILGPSRPNVWSPADAKAGGSMKHVHRMYHEGIPLEEFKTNPELQFTTVSKKGKPPTQQYTGAPEHVGNDFHQLQALYKNLKDLAIKGVNGKHWYDESSEWIKHVVGNDPKEADKLAQALAITSANTGVDDNLARAFRAHNTFKRAKLLGKYLPIYAGGDPGMDRNLDKMYYGDIAGGHTQKVSNYYQNLMKRIDPSIPQHSTQDRHMMKAFGYKSEIPKPQEYAFMHNMMREIAHKLTDESGEPWSPDQVQAAIWTAHRANKGNQGLSNPTAMEKRIKKALKGTKNEQRGEFALDPDAALNVFAPIREHNSAIHEMAKHVAGSDIPDDQKSKLIDWIRNYKKVSPPGTGTKMEAGIASALDALDKAKARQIKESGLGALEAHTLSDLKNQDLQREASSNQLNLTSPQLYTYMHAAHDILPSQLNFEAVPSSDAVPMNGFQEHAPYHLRQAMSRELAPIAREMLTRLGVLRGSSDVIAMGDWGKEHNTQYGISVPTPQVGRRGVHDQSHNLIKLAADTLALAFRQNGVPYMNLHPVDLKNGKDPMLNANAASFKFSGDKWLGHEELRNVIATRDRIARKVGIDPESIPVVGSTTQGSPSLTLLNRTEGDPGAWELSNAQFHGLARLIMDHAGLPPEMNIEHYAAQNHGGMTYEDWKDDDGNGSNGTITKRAGDNLRNEIRKSGADSIAKYADSVYEQRIKPIFDRYAGWRSWPSGSAEGYQGEDPGSRADEAGYDAGSGEYEPNGLESIHFSEQEGAGQEAQRERHHRAGEQPGREGHRGSAKPSRVTKLQAIRLAGISGVELSEVFRYSKRLIKLSESSDDWFDPVMNSKARIVLACIRSAAR